MALKVILVVLSIAAALTVMFLILRPLSVIADVVPILGSIVGAGTGIISLLLAAILSLITVAIAWIVYRPLFGIILILVAVGLTMAIRWKLKSARSTA